MSLKDGDWIYGPPPIVVIIRRLRIERGISQERMAKLAGVAKSTYCRLERGWRQKPRWGVIAPILETLGISLDAARKAERKLIEKLEERDQIAWVEGLPRIVRPEYLDLYRQAMEEAKRTGQYWRNVLRKYTEGKRRGGPLGASGGVVVEPGAELPRAGGDSA